MTEPYVHEPHTWGPSQLRKIPWQKCRYCGLVALRNSLTKFCVEKGCNYEDHPGYKTMLKRRFD